MRPEATARTILSTTRARAKMREFRVAPEDYNALPRNPGMLFSLAVGILGDVAAAVAEEIAEAPGGGLPVPEGWEELGAEPGGSIRFASTFFDAFLNADLDAELTTELSLLCASAYYLSGNLGSATVITRHMAEPDVDHAGGLSFLAYRILRNDFKPIDEPHTHSKTTNAVLETLAAFFRFDAGEDDLKEVVDDMRAYFHVSGSPRELLYADIIGALCALKLQNAARNLLPDASDLDEELWRPALAKPHFPIELWPAQQRIANADVLRGRSVVIQMPTSAGKTRATELIIRSAFLSKRADLAVIVAPYRSLCHDIRGDLAAAFAGEAVRLDEVSDSYRFDIQLEALLAENSILIVTPEKLLYMLRRAPELAEQIGLVIYDEGHQFDGLTRGPTYELLLTSLRMALRPATQIILISAVIGNAPEVAGWLLGDSEAIVGGDGLLPTSKSIAFASWKDQRGQLQYVNPEDPQEREFFVPRIISATVLRPRPRERVDKIFPEMSGGDIGLFLGLHVVSNGSVAIFCGRKDSVRKICARAVELTSRGHAVEWPLAVSDPEEVERIRSLCQHELGATAPATLAATLGIFAHHADTPHGIRLAIEHAMKVGLTKFVVCTSTLAQGVNFPLKYLIVTSTRQGADRILVRDFHNLMGRAGRAGMHTEGSVIFSTPSIYDQRAQFRGQFIWQSAVELLDARNSEPSRSSILALFEPYEQRQPPIVQELQSEWLDLAFADAARIEKVVATALEIDENISASEFKRFIEGRAKAIQSIASFLVSNMTFSDEEDAGTRARDLAANTLAYHMADDETRAQLVEVFQSIGQTIAANTDVDQRALIRRSPLPPAAIAALQQWLLINVEALLTACAENRLLEAVLSIAIEFTSARTVRDITVPSVIPQTLREWVAGNSYGDIQKTLRDVGARIGRGNATVEDAVALCEGGFGYDVAMVLASLADLAEGVDENLHAALTLLQSQVKHGLAERSAIAFYEAGFADRHIASTLGAAWPSVVDKADVRTACRSHDAMRNALIEFPSYFTTVAAELGQWA